MSEIEKNVVSIEIGSKIHARYADFTNSPSHTIAEFIDNALQSYRDNKIYLHSINPNFRFRVLIDFVWGGDDTEQADKIIISDNAAGLNFNSFHKAFMTAEPPENNTGLNEFGMGMKTAAGWLGEKWSVCTTALGEDLERTLVFDLKEVVKKNLKELPYEKKEASLDDHYTIVTIEKPTKNSPARKILERIKSELASIYRQSIREGEMDLIICGEVLEFEEYPILDAPFTRNPNGASIKWKKEIDFQFRQYKAKGFIAILKDINYMHNGLVLLRRGRVVVGAGPEGRYFPKSIFGSQGNFRYKRLFGELHLEGFDVSFNKSDIQNKDNLEALMLAIRDEIHTKEFDLYTQADEYRLDENRKAVNKIIKKHNAIKKNNDTPIDIFQPKVDNILQCEEPETIEKSPAIINEYKDTYKIKGVTYTLRVKYVSATGDNLFWVDISKMEDKEIICMIDTNHIFFEHFKNDYSISSILKAFAIAKFTAKIEGNDTASEMLNYFNQYIKETKIQ